MTGEIELLLRSSSQFPEKWKWLEWKEQDLLSDQFPDDSKWVQVALPLNGGKGLLNFLGKFFIIKSGTVYSLINEYKSIGNFKDESRAKLIADIAREEVFSLILQDFC